MSGLNVEKRKGNCLMIEGRADFENVEAVIENVNAFIKEAGCPDYTRRNVDAVIDDVLTNVVDYAYDEAAAAAGTDLMKVQCQVDNGEIALVFRDGGKPFNPLEEEEPEEFSLPQFGGLGIHIVINLSDEVEYRYEDGCNVLTVKMSMKEAGQ